MRKTSLLTLFLLIIALIANINYLFFLLNPAHADNPGLYALTVLADSISILIFSSTWALTFYFECCKPRYSREIAELRIAGKALTHQRTAILITVVNEDLALVRNTIQCAKNVLGNTAIYILDDGKRSQMHALASFMHVQYIARPGNAFFKAGNLEYALIHHVKEPYFVVVDADFALAPTFLQRTLPLFIDPRIAAVQTPQIYSNTDTFFSKGFQHLQELFYNAIQPGKHLLGSAFIVGTNVIYRRAAIEECGGIAQVADSEDIFTTIKLLEQKYSVFYLNEPLAAGLSATTLISFSNQQYRWARGGLRMLFKHCTLFNKALSAEQRIQFFCSNFFYLSGVSLCIALINPLLAILLNVKPIADGYSNAWAAAYLPFFLMNFGLSLLFIKRYRFQACVLGVLSVAPYLSALRATLIGRAFQWKITNQASRGLITRLLAPHIMYLMIAFTTGLFLFSGAITYDPTLRLYYGWLAINSIILFICIIVGYSASSHETVPTFDNTIAPEISTAEMLSILPFTKKEAAPFIPSLDEVPTVRLNSLSLERKAQ